MTNDEKELGEAAVSMCKALKAQALLIDGMRISQEEALALRATNPALVAAFLSHRQHDVRSGGFVIEAYRACALASLEGVVALACAFRQLYVTNGELPRVELFDEELTRGLKVRLSELSNLDSASVK